MTAKIFGAIAVAILPATAAAQWQPGGVALGNGRFPAIVSDGAGGAIVAWDYAGLQIKAQRLDSSGVAQWNPGGVTLSTSAPGLYALPFVVSDGAGGAIVLWNQPLRAQRVNADGVAQWTPGGVIVCQTVVTSTAAAVHDDAGGVIVAWQDHRPEEARPFAEEHIFAQRLTANGVPQWTPNGVMLSDPNLLQFGTWIVPDDAGGAIVLWNQLYWDDTYFEWYDEDVYAQRLDASGNKLWAGTLNGAPIVNNPFIFDQISHAAPDGSGGAFIGHIGEGCFVQKIDENGSPQWGGGVEVGVFQPLEPFVISDMEGGVLVAWQEDGNVRNIFAQRLNSDGIPVWPAPSTPVSTAPGNQIIWDMASDGAGGALIVWHDLRADNNFRDVYAQHLRSWGSPEWDANGKMIANGPRDQQDPVLISDGANGAIIAFDDTPPTGLTQVKVQHVTSISTGIDDRAAFAGLSVSDGYPNPFLAGTRFEIALARSAYVTTEVFDVSGKRLRHTMARHARGNHVAWFDGCDDSGNALPSGVYFYRVNANGSTITKKTVLAR